MDRSFALERTLFAATRTDLHRSEKPLGPSSKDELQKTPNRKTPSRSTSDGRGGELNRKPGSKKKMSQGS